MRIIKPRYHKGELRTIKKFLLFPTTVWREDTRKTRWLETATIMQVYDYNPNTISNWTNFKFMDDEEQ